MRYKIFVNLWPNQIVFCANRLVFLYELGISKASRFYKLSPYRVIFKRVTHFVNFTSNRVVFEGVTHLL